MVSRDLPENKVEVAQFIYQGLNEVQGFSGLTYIAGTEKVEMVFEEEGTYRSEYDEPLVGDEAAPKVKELIKALI